MEKKQNPITTDEIQNAIKKQHNDEVKEFLTRYKEFSKNEKFDFGVQLSVNKFGILPQLILVDKPITDTEQEQEQVDEEQSDETPQEPVIQEETNNEQTN